MSLSKMNQSGCSINDIPKWTGTAWVCDPKNEAIYSADELSLHLNGSNVFSALSSSVTLMANTFNGYNQLLKLDGSGLVPDANISGDITRDSEWDTWAEHPALTSGHILIGDTANKAADVAVSGDVTVSSSGVTAIGTDRITNGMLQSGALLRDVPVRLNPIAVNDASGRHRAPDEAEWTAFRDALARELPGQPIVRRYSGGKDESAACGMLAARSARDPG